ncbi:acetolactate synthase 3 large subunit, partial [Rhizobium ruizarguesonis]
SRMVSSSASGFSPNSKKIHIDIDPSSINKNVRVDIGIRGDVGHVLEDMVRLWRALPKKPEKGRLEEWWTDIARWRARNSFAYTKRSDVI